VRRLYGNLVVLAHLRGQRRIAYWKRPRIEALRDRRIRHIISYAARTVPYYRDLFAHLRIDPRDIRTAKDLDALPLLDRDTVRSDPQLFHSEARRARGSLAFLTSGSTGTALQIRHDRASVLANIAFGERERAPVIELCGGSFRPKELYIGYETSNFRKVLDFYARNTRLPVPRRQSISMTAPFEEIVAAINRVQPDLLTAYGGFLDVFFRTLAARAVPMHRPKVVMYVGEALPLERRDWIERELGIRVMSRYCAVEAFKIGYFCERRTGFHMHDDLCHVRVVAKNGAEAAAGEPGEIVISNLVNHATVLLNYPMGDVAAWSAEGCGCGRNQRLLSEIHGRVEDMLPLPTGETLHPRAVWAVFKDDPEILQYQLIQRDLRHFELKLVTADDQAFAGARDRAVTELRLLLGGDARIDTSRHAELGRNERESTGKFRAVESRLRETAAQVTGASGGDPGR
jgi:phenylacetate-CoA ligase